MRKVVGSSSVIIKDFLHFLFLFGIFNVKTEIHGIHDNKLFDIKHYGQTNNCECFN